MAETSRVTAADIARIARVSRTTVSNWRRRHKAFPCPVGGTANRALFDRAQVEAWLAEGGRLPERTAHEHLWELILGVAGASGVNGVTGVNGVSGAAGPESSGGAGAGGAVGTTGVGGVGGAAGDLGEVVADVQEMLLRLSEGGGGTAGGTGKGLAERTGGSALVDAVREAAAAPGRAHELSAHLHDAYLGALGGRAHITPGPLSRLMADLAGGRGSGLRGAEVFDPACGTGTLLSAAAAAGATGLFGQEKAGSLSRITRARLVVGAHNSAGGGVRVAEGDSLVRDAYAGRRFDAVLCNPPFNQKDWGVEQLAYDERWAYGVPPRSEPELAWIQHCLAHTRPGGRIVVLIPPAAASRPSGRRIRRELLRRGALRAVVGLPAGAAAPVHVGLHLWVLEQPVSVGEAQARPQVLFVDTETVSRTADGEKRRPIEWDRVRESLDRAWRGFLDQPEKFQDVPGFCQAVPLVELLDDVVDLTPGRRLPSSPREVTAAQARWGAGKMRRRTLKVLNRVRTVVPGEGWGERAAEEWRMVPMGDLARSGALVLYRASSVASGACDSDEETWGVGRRALSLRDVLRGREPSGYLADPSSSDVSPKGADPDESLERVKIHAGDVIVPATLARKDLSRSRVATDADAGSYLGLNLHLIRPDPEHIDPWFLAGFLDDEDNLRWAGHGSTITRIDLRKLRIPLLSLDEQRRYGAAFRELYDFRTELGRAREAALDLGDRLSSGLRSGLLSPPLIAEEDNGEAGAAASNISQT